VGAVQVYAEGLVRVALPDVLERFGEGLGFDCVVYVAGVAGEEELVRVVLGGEDAGHVLVGDDPVVHVVAHHVGVVEVTVAYFEPEAQRLAAGFGDESSVEAPGTLRSLRVPRPLLVDVGTGVSEDAVVEVGVIPGHDEGTGATGAAAHGGAGVGIVAELDVGLCFDKGKNLMFYELGVVGGHGVVFETAFAALRVASAVLDGDGDHGRQLVFGDEVVEDGEEEMVRAVGSYDEGRDAAGDILRGDIDGDVAGVGRGVAGGDDEAGGVGGVGRAEGAGVTGDAGVILAVGGGHGDVGEGALRDAGVNHGLGRGRVGWAEDEVAVRGGCGESVVGELGGGDVAWGVGVAGRWWCVHG